MKNLFLLGAVLCALGVNAQSVYKPYKEFIFEAGVNQGDSAISTPSPMLPKSAPPTANASENCDRHTRT